MKDYSFPPDFPNKFPFIDRKMWEKPMTKFSKHCKECDSAEIFQQTYWTWNVESQDWKASDDDVITCSDCGYSGYSYVTKKVQEPRTEEQE